MYAYGHFKYLNNEDLLKVDSEPIDYAWICFYVKELQHIGNLYSTASVVLQHN